MSKIGRGIFASIAHFSIVLLCSTMYSAKEVFDLKDEFIPRVGIWGQRHYNYLKKSNPTVVNVMRMKGTLEQYLTDLDRDVQDMFGLLMKQYTEVESITEHLKLTNQLEWVRQISNIRNSVTEIVCKELIYI